ncbi:Rpp14/Pop5 family protein [Nanoarchaeota archaeon]
MPSLRERKRYLAFEIISKQPVNNPRAIKDAIFNTALQYLGELGCAEAGLIFIDKFNTSNQRGLIRVSHKSLDRLRATLALVQQIEGQEVIVRSIGASGILKKADDRYIAG